MKTPEQIKAWLEAQPWYEQFKNYTLNPDMNPAKRLEIDSTDALSGDWRDLTILCAFNWLKTNEGYMFWVNIDSQFRKWCNDENPD